LQEQKVANETRECDVIVVGAGMVGLTLAAALGRREVSVAIVDAQPFDALQGRARDGRTSAIAAGSRAVMERAGAWESIAPRAEPILEIRVSDSGAPLFLHYDHALIDEGPLGWIAENADIREALIARVRATDAVVALDGRAVESLTRETPGVVARLSDGTRVRAALAVAADGHNSALRRAAGIGCMSWRYPQSSIVCTVAHERPHRGIAHEQFLPAGPFAILPMTGNRSSIVWTERAALVPDIVKLPRADFTRELARRFGDFLGPLSVEGEVFVYPLALSHAHRYTDRRLALIGDAAHTIHPIAGQGLNLGLRDVTALCDAIEDARSLGLDLGGGATLAPYERARRFDNTLMIALTDGLNRLFSNTLAPVRLARDAGLAAVNRTPPLKRAFMRHAMGLRP
jgi:2-octaprenyl-6-methoxyphenol hydroxylase